MPSVTRLLDDSAMASALERMAGEVVEVSGGTRGLMLVGIQRRGVELAGRLAGLIGKATGTTIPLGKLDITLYRDDLTTIGPRPRVGETSLPDSIEGKTIVVVDDVLYTGRTSRAALDELADFGRPRRIALAVLIDRGGRELPIQPDVVGKVVSVPAGSRIDVLVKELDERDAVVMAPKEPTT